MMCAIFLPSFLDLSKPQIHGLSQVFSCPSIFIAYFFYFSFHTDTLLEGFCLSGLAYSSEILLLNDRFS